MVDNLTGKNTLKMENLEIDNKEYAENLILVDEKTHDFEFVSLFALGLILLIVAEMYRIFPNKYITTYYKVTSQVSGVRKEVDDKDLEKNNMMHIEVTDNNIKPIYKTHEVSLLLLDVEPNQNFTFDLLTCIEFYKDNKQKIKVNKSYQKEITTLNQTTNMTFNIMKNTLINFTEVKLNLMFQKSMKSKEKFVTFRHENHHFISLFVWFNIFLQTLFGILILIRLFNINKISKEQLYCTILSIGTLLYDEPLQILLYIRPNEIQKRIGVFLKELYPIFIFIFVINELRICFNQKTSTKLFIVILFFSLIEVYSAIKKSQFPLQFIIGEEENYNNDKYLHMAELCFTLVYTVLLKRTGVEEHEKRFRTYNLIAFIIMIVYSCFLVMLERGKINETILIELIPYVLINFIAFLMEFLHSNAPQTVEDVYETPNSDLEGSSTAINNSLLDDAQF